MTKNSARTVPAVTTRPTWRLPAIAMAVLAVVYLVTLNYHANLWNEVQATRVCGWQWLPTLQQPLLYLFELPFHLLPVVWRPVALNLGNMVLAVAVLGLLVRCVALWPADRTPDMRQWELEPLGILPAGALGWLPPLFSALILGLTLNFWEQATSTSGEMIDVLVVAWVIYCLLEFRREWEMKWLWRMAVAYGVGMVNNWALIGLFPCLLLTLASIHGWKDLLLQVARTLQPIIYRNQKRPDQKFKRTRMPSWRSVGVIFLGLLAGLLLYFLLPLIYLATGDGSLTFWKALLAPLKSQKAGLSQMWRFLASNGRVMVLAFSSLVPLLLVAIRWRDDSPNKKHWNTHWGLLGVHVIVAGVCLLVLWGGALGPAQILPGQPFLTHYFLCALSLGCCLNYFIKLLLGRPGGIVNRRRTSWERRLRGTVVILLLLVTVAVLAEEARRSGQVIRLTNKTLPEDFQRRVLGQLPAGPKVLLADDPGLLNLSRLLLLGTPEGKDTIFIDTTAGVWVDYHRRQAESYPQPWQNSILYATNHGKLPPILLDRLLKDLSADRQVFYLHPSVINSFDHFQMQRAGFCYELTFRSTNAPAEVHPAANDQAWAEFEQQLMPQLTNVIEIIQPQIVKGHRKGRLSGLIKPREAYDVTSAFFSHYYSSEANARGVELQMAGRWADAARSFTNALNLNPNNYVAQLNLDFNGRHQAGTESVTNSEGLELGAYRNIEQEVGLCGPIDEPFNRITLGNYCAKNKLPFHAMDQFQRVYELQPANWGAKLWLASLNLNAGRPAATLQVLREVRQILSTNGYLTNYVVNLDVIEAQADLALTNKAAATAVLGDAIDSSHGDPKLMADAVQALWQAGLKDEARELMDHLVQQHPASAPVYTMRGLVFLQMGKLEDADKDLSQALILDPKNQIVRFKRGYVRVQMKQYDAAQADFESMLQSSTNAFPAYFAMAQISRAKNDLPKAKSQLETYLQYASTNSPDYNAAIEQLKSLP